MEKNKEDQIDSINEEINYEEEQNIIDEKIETKGDPFEQKKIIEDSDPFNEEKINLDESNISEISPQTTNKPSKKILLTLVLLFFSIIGLVYFFSFMRIVGSGIIVEEVKILPVFDSIELKVNATIHFTQEKTSYKIVGEDNIISNIQTKVDKGKLIISQKPFKYIKPKENIDIYISNYDISNILIKSSGRIVSDKSIEKNSLNITIDGTGEVDLRLNVNDLKTTIKGAANVSYKGVAKNHIINISGTGIIKSYNLISNRVDVNVGGSGICEIFAGLELNVFVKGVGRINYRGNPPKMSKKINGTGIVEKGTY